MRFAFLSNEETLVYFRFEKRDVLRLANIVGGLDGDCVTSRNRYRTTPLLTTCVILRRLATPFRWKDVELFFGKHSAQLSEIFWEGLEHFLSDYGYLVTGEVGQDYMEQNAERYAEAVHNKTNALENCVGFIDGTVLGIARPGNNGLQNVVYNGHKRKHALKFQALSTPDCMFLHIAGPLEGRRHDWTLYARSGLDQQLENVLFIDGKQYCVYADSGCNWRVYLEIPFQGSVLTEEQAAFNRAMSVGRVTVEWIFKEVKQYFTTVDFKRKLKIGEAPVGSLYIAALLLKNSRNCLYPNQTSQYFQCKPPTLETFVSWKPNTHST